MLFFFRAEPFPFLDLLFFLKKIFTRAENDRLLGDAIYLVAQSVLLRSSSARVPLGRPNEAIFERKQVKTVKVLK